MSSSPMISADIALKAFAVLESALILAGRDQEFSAKVNQDIARTQILSAFPEQHREAACAHMDTLCVNLVRATASDSTEGIYG